MMDAFEKISESFAVLSSAGNESSLPIILLAYTASLLSHSSSRCVPLKTSVEESRAVVFVDAETTVEAAMYQQKQVFIDDFFGCVWLLFTVGTLTPLKSTQKSRLPTLQGSLAVARAVLQLYLHCSGVTIGLVILTETLGQAADSSFQSTTTSDYCVMAYLVLYLAFPCLIINRSRGMVGNAWIVLLDVFIVLNALLAYLFIQSLFRTILVTTNGLFSMIALVIATSSCVLFPLLRACITNDYRSALILLQSWIPHTLFLPTSFVLVPIHALFCDIRQHNNTNDGSDVSPQQPPVSQREQRGYCTHGAAWSLCFFNATLAGLSRMLRVVKLRDMTLLAVLMQIFIYISFAIVIMTTILDQNFGSCLTSWRGKSLACNWFSQRFNHRTKSESEQASLDLRRRFGDNRADINQVIASIRLVMGDDGDDNPNGAQTTTAHATTIDNEMMI